MTNWCFAVQILIAQEVWSTATEIASPQGKVIKDKVHIILKYIYCIYLQV